MAKAILIRLDEDLHAELVSAAHRAEQPAAEYVREAIRHRLRHRIKQSGSVPVDGQEASRRAGGVSTEAPPRAEPKPAKCLHPPGRRIGDSCGACGAKV